MKKTEATLIEPNRENSAEEVETVIRRTEEANLPQICYIMKHKTEEIPIKVVNGKMECPICQTANKNVQLHFKKKTECSDKIDMGHFITIYEEYRKQNDRIKQRIRDQRFKTRQKESNPGTFHLANKESVEKTQKKRNRLT